MPPREVLGADPDYSELKTAGLTDSQIARMLMERHGVEESPETVGAFLRAYEARLPARLPERQGQVLDGVQEILDDLRERPGVHSLLLTGNTQAGAAAKLAPLRPRRLLRGRRLLHGHGSTATRSPAARSTSRRRRSATPPELERTFVIGDTAHDIARGKAIGARTVAIASGVVTAEELEREGPWLVWERLPEPEGFAQALGLPARA